FSLGETCVEMKVELLSQPRIDRIPFRIPCWRLHAFRQLRSEELLDIHESTIFGIVEDDIVLIEVGVDRCLSQHRHCQKGLSGVGVTAHPEISALRQPTIRQSCACQIEKGATSREIILFSDSSLLQSWLNEIALKTHSQSFNKKTNSGGCL